MKYLYFYYKVYLYKRNFYVILSKIYFIIVYFTYFDFLVSHHSCEKIHRNLYLFKNIGIIKQ
jgi:hypothetical protein